jgi:hypothetical protein
MSIVTTALCFVEKVIASEICAIISAVLHLAPVAFNIMALAKQLVYEDVHDSESDTKKK